MAVVSAVGPARDLVLCADDYGLNEGVSRAILELAARGRVSATSCMTNAPAWRGTARALAAFRGRIGIGLHLTLTWGGPLGGMPSLAPAGSFPALRQLVAKALTGRLFGRRVREEIRREIERQLDAFEDALGRRPDFVDGHQHVHVLPGVREALLETLSRRPLAGRLWLRDPTDRPSAILARRLAAPKALFVGALAGGFGREARLAGFHTNSGFSGFSPFDPARDPGRDMEAYLAALGRRPLVMCHPGLPDPDGDEIAAARRREFDYLSSRDFAQALASRGLVLAPAPP